MNVAGCCALLYLVCAACAARPAAAPPADPPPVDDWHREPVLSRLARGNIAFYNHADASFDDETIVALLQRQYDWLRDYVQVAPPWIRVHAGSGYPCGFSTNIDGTPEMFLQSGGIFDTENNYAHEMGHCFTQPFGDLPHWFNESLSDVLYADAEIELWRRRKEAEFLAQFDRVDHRSYELMQLRTRFGRTYFRAVFAAMRARSEEFRSTMRAEVDLEDKNRLILAVLSQAAGRDLTDVFVHEFGFNPRTRERQRGY